MKEGEVIIIFARNLLFGTVKTRLAASVGDHQAMEVYKQLSQHTKSITDALPVHKIVFYSTFVDHNDEWDNKGYSKQVQFGNDLGERMKNAFSFVFRSGYSKAVIIGTDCPALDENIILDAFKKLDDADVVIGPAYDGGYYLLGLKQLHAALFDDMQWSTTSVLPETIKRCRSNHLSFVLLQQLHDVDEEKDLLHLKLIQA